MKKLAWTILLGAFFISSRMAMCATLEFSPSIVKYTRDSILMQVAVQNSGATSLELFKADLPWETRHSLLLVAVTDEAEHTCVLEALSIDDPGPGEVTLPPAARLSGTIDLVRRFPDLPRVLEKRAVIVFWSYAPTTTGGGRLERISGALTLPKM